MGGSQQPLLGLQAHDLRFAGLALGPVEAPQYGGQQPFGAGLGVMGQPQGLAHADRARRHWVDPIEADSHLGPAHPSAP